MNIDISEHFKVSDILSAVKEAEEGSHIYCSSERHFSLLKICLIKLQKVDLSIYLLDQHGFTVKQVSARKKATAQPVAPASTPSSTLTATPLAAVDSPEAAVAVQPAQEPSPALGPVPQPHSAVVHQTASEQSMSSKQISVLRDLEQALRRCKEQELLVIGFSDGLVAVPEALGYGADAISSADALEVEAFDVYRGYEADGE